MRGCGEGRDVGLGEAEGIQQHIYRPRMAEGMEGGILTLLYLPLAMLPPCARQVLLLLPGMEGRKGRNEVYVLCL